MNGCHEESVAVIQGRTARERSSVRGRDEKASAEAPEVEPRFRRESDDAQDPGDTRLREAGGKRKRGLVCL